MNHQKKYLFAFTLVELIVVIVILAILATIAFLSFNSYSSSSRDSVRLSDINSLNKSLELFNISAAKYPDPTNVYMTVVYSGGAIFEQGKLGDSVITAVQKMSKKPVDPLKNTEYTYSVNMTNTAFQLKANLESKPSTGYNDANENSIPHLTPAYRQAGHSNTGEELISSVIENETAPISSFGAKGNGVEEPAYRQAGLENNSSSLLSNVFNGLKGIFDIGQIPAFAGMTSQVNADINSGSTVCYIKGNFNGLIEKTNTGNINYILAVPGLVLTDSGTSSTNTMIDYNTLSGKVICNGLNDPCVINFIPTPVFVGSGNTLPITYSQIQDLMNQLQTAYSGSNITNTPVISNLLNSSGSALTSLGLTVTKAGVIDISCPAGFIRVPGNDEFNQPDFCVAKYEIKAQGGSAGPSANGITYKTHDYNVANVFISNANDMVVTNITQNQAISACKSIGAGYHLITNNERMTIARNIEQQSSNWSNGESGSGYIYSGHNDNTPTIALTGSQNDTDGYFGTLDSAVSPGDNAYGLYYSSNVAQAYKGQRRTLILSNGEIIWDFAGNVREHVNKANNLDGVGYNSSVFGLSNVCGGSNWYAFNVGETIFSAPGGVCNFQTPYNYGNVGPKISGLNANNGIGRIFSFNTSNNIYIRGGYFGAGSHAGIYTLHANWGIATFNFDTGFRCAK